MTNRGKAAFPDAAGDGGSVSPARPSSPPAVRGVSIERTARNYRLHHTCAVCGINFIRYSLSALFEMGSPSPRWPKRKQVIFDCPECGHLTAVMTAVSRDVLEFC